MVLNCLIQTLGLYVLGNIIYGVWRIVEEIYLIKEKNLPEEYGKGTWAIVTGATNGIGFGFVKQLAKRGMNVILIARNQEKLDARMKEVKAEFPSVQVKSVKADFKESTDPSLFERIDKEIGDLEVSVLINNVGVSHNGFTLLEADHQSLHDLVTINCTAQLMMTKLFQQRTEKRQGSRSACVFLSSIGCIKPFPGKCSYAASKIFTKRLGLGLRLRNKESIDYLILKPGFVSTPLTNNRKMDIFTSSADECAEGALKALGNRTETWGSNRHILWWSTINAIFWFVPVEFLHQLAGLMFKALGYDASKKYAKRD